MTSKLQNHQFADYFKHYTSLVDTSKEISDVLDEAHQQTNDLLDLITEDRGDFAYDTDKWTIKELLIHLIDTERIFCNRALRFARNDKTELPGYDHDDYVTHSFAHLRTLADILQEYDLVRGATIALFESFTDDMLKKEGVANNNALTVMTIGYIIAGHEKHHITILKDRYL